MELTKLYKIFNSKAVACREPTRRNLRECFLKTMNNQIDGISEQHSTYAIQQAKL